MEKKPRKNFQVEKTRWKKEGEGSESGQEKRAERKIEERANLKENLEPWGSWTNRMHGKLRRTVQRENEMGKINTICGTRASNKEEIKMTLDQAPKCFLCTPAGKRTDLKRKVKAHAWLYCAASSYRARGKQLDTFFFFLKPSNAGGPRSYHGMLRRRRGQLDVPLDIWNLRGRKTGDAHGDATRSLAEFSLERVFFLERSDNFMISSRKEGEKTAWQ